VWLFSPGFVLQEIHRRTGIDHLVFNIRGWETVSHQLPVDGTYRVRVGVREGTPFGTFAALTNIDHVRLESIPEPASTGITAACITALPRRRAGSARSN
jgi:hypothetical protein